MHYFILSNKDSTIKSYYPNVNFGQDHFIEIGTSERANKPFINTSRTLLSFGDNNIISNLLLNSGSVKVFLNLYSIKSEIIPTNNLNIHNVISDWQEGIGKTEYEYGEANGVTWNIQPTTGNFSQSAILPINNFDCKIDITKLVSSSIQQNSEISFLLKYDSNLETYTGSYSNYKFYSTQTNTIYQPRLEISYSDYTGSGLTKMDDIDIVIVNKNLFDKYQYNTITQLKVYGRKLYPTRTWKENYSNTMNLQLPNYVYYSLIDHITNEVIIDFDENTRISCDEQNNYFNFNFSGLFPNRFYKFRYKIIYNNFEKLLNDSPIFKVIR